MDSMTILNFPMRFSVSVFPLFLSFNNLKLHKTQAVKNIFIQGNGLPPKSFKPASQNLNLRFYRFEQPGCTTKHQLHTARLMCHARVQKISKLQIYVLPYL